MRDMHVPGITGGKRTGMVARQAAAIAQFHVQPQHRHFGQAAKDIEEIKISSEKAGKRARRLDNFDFEELAPETAQMIGAAE